MDLSETNEIQNIVKDILQNKISKLKLKVKSKK